MLSLTPSMTPADTHGVFKLLDLLTDPNAVKQRLAELLKAKQELDASAAAAQEATAALASQRAANALRVEALNRASVEHDNRKQEISARERSVVAREIEVQKAARDVEDWSTRLNSQRDNDNKDLANRRTNLDAEWARLNRQKDEVAKLKAELQGKLAKIKEINDAVL